MIRQLKPEYQHYLGSFVLQASMMVAMTLIPFFTFQHLAGRERAAALAYGVQTLSLGVACLLSTFFVSALRNGLICCLIGSVGFGICYSLAAFTTKLLAFCILTGLSMAFFALAWPALQSWLGAQSDPKLRTKSFSYFNVAIGLGLTLGPLFAGVFYEVNFRLPFLGVLLLSLLAAALISTLPRECEYFGSSTKTGIRDTTDTAGLKRDDGNEIFLYCGWLTNLLGWGLTGAVRTVYAGQLDRLVDDGRLVLFTQNLPLHVFTAHGSPNAATLYSWLQATLSLGFFVAILAIGRTTRWQHRFWVLVIAQTFVGLAIWVLADSRSLLVLLMCHAVMGAFTGFGYLGSQCYSAANPTLKHRRIATNEGLSALTGFALPLAFAQLGVWKGITWPFRNIPLFLAGFVVLQFISVRYAKRQLAHRILAAQQA